ETVAGLIPECLELDAFNNEFAFLAVAIVKTKNLRPKGFPGFLGNDFILIGYRVFVRFQNSKGKNLRGLYILKSETNRKKMEFFGNIFTHYNYSTTDISIKELNNKIQIHSKKSELKIELLKNGFDSKLPENSPFENWKEARKFAGPMPFTFTFGKNKSEVLTREGVRTNWKPAPLEILSESIGFFDERNLGNGILANAFIVENIPYYWKKGKTEKW